MAKKTTTVIYTPTKHKKKTRQGHGRGTKFGNKGSKKFYVKKI